MTIEFRWLSKIGLGKKELKMEKSTSGEWRVKRGYKVLFVGTEDRCLMFMAEADADS